MKYSVCAVLLAVCCASCGGPETRVITPTQPPVTIDPPTQPVVPPTLAVTRILAFGDSLTEGESLGQLLAPALHDHGTAGALVSYPFKLQTILNTTYTAQTIRVFNGGVGGETVVGSQAKDRMLRELGIYQPQVMLLLHGVNNVNAIDQPLVRIVEAIEELIELAHARNVHVILGNLPPQIPSPKATGGARIAVFNAQLPAVAAEEGATFVDIHSNINTQTMLMPDGLHLNETGNQKLAELFYAALRAKYHKDPGQ